MNKFKSLGLTAIFILAGASVALALNLDNLRNYFLNANYSACIKEGENVLAQSSSHKGLDEVYYILGLSYLKEGNYLRASDIFEIVLNEYRDSKFKDEAKLGLGDSYFMKGDYSKAQSIYRELLKHRPQTKLKPAVYYRLSEVGKRTNNRDKHQFYLAKLKNEFSQSPEALSNKEFLPGFRNVYVPEVSRPAAAKSKPIVTTRNIVNSEAAKPVNAQENIAAAPTIKTVDHDQELISGSCSIQVGAFSSAENARKLTLKLKAQGYASYISLAESFNKKIYKVRIGGFSSLQEAKDAEIKLKTKGYPTKIVL
ncbi:MAG: SPOR domain-containing protein [Candidatus Omnitrophica bacterium]|nr:SPOR domain-containing protein [Candidatus Omnitrophota bacterium]